MRFALAILSVAVLALAACGIPSRDNPADPINRPAAHLIVVDRTLPNGRCPVDSAGVPPVSGPQVFVASRGRCLALEGRGSADPHGAALSYAFLYQTTAGSISVPGEGGLAPLSHSFLVGLPVGSPVVFSVTATDPDGGSDSAQASVVLQNSRPVAVAPVERSLPRGGFPWTSGQSDRDYQVSFSDNGSSDPDGDPLAGYCWTFPDAPGEICKPDPNDPLFTRRLPAATAQRYIALYRVTDGNLYSQSVVCEVVVGDETVWSRNGALTEHLDNARFAPPLPTGAVGALLAAYGPSQGALAWETSFNSWQIDIVDQQTLVPYPGFSTSEYLTSIVGDPLHGRIWYEGLDHLGALSVAPGTFALTTSFSPLLLGQTNFGDGIETTSQITIDTAGNAWYWYEDAPILYVISGQGTTLATIEDPNREWTGLAARPGTGEMWGVRTTSLNATVASDAELIHYASPGSSAVEIPLTGHASAYALGWLDQDLFWIEVLDVGLELVDASVLDGGGTFAQAVQLIVPGVFDPRFLLVDPVGRIAWAYEYAGSNSLYQVTETGILQIASSPFPNSINPQFMDGAGEVWFSGSQNPDLQRSAFPSADGVLVTPTVANLYAVSPNLSDGGAWLTTFTPNFYLRLAEDGTVLREISSVVTTSGALSHLPEPYAYAFAASPDGGSAWATGFQTPLFFYDFSTEPATAHLVLDSATTATLDQLAYYASPPGYPPTLWTDNATSIVAVGTSGGLRVLFTPPSPEIFPQGAVTALSPASNRLCVVTGNYSVPGLVLRRLSADGTSQLLATIPIPGAATSHAAVIDGIVARASADPDDMCWVAWHEVATGVVNVQGFAAPGPPLESVSVNSVASLFDAHSAGTDRIWLGVQGTNGSFERIRLDAVAGSFTNPLRLDFPTDGQRQFAEPGGGFNLVAGQF